MAESCTYPRCRSRAIEVIYFGRDLCRRCWLRICRIESYPRIAELLKLRRRCVVSESGIGMRES